MATPREILKDIAEDVRPCITNTVPGLLRESFRHLTQAKNSLGAIKNQNPVAVDALEHLIACVAQTIALLEGE